MLDKEVETINIIHLLTYLWCFLKLWLGLHLLLLVTFLVRHHHHQLFILTQGSGAEEVRRLL